MAIKRLAVVSVAASVLRTELFSMKQDHGETVLAFSSRALSKARNCKLTVRCPHDSDVDYSEEMVKQVVLAGMYDEEIKRKVLSTVGIDDYCMAYGHMTSINQFDWLRKHCDWSL